MSLVSVESVPSSIGKYRLLAELGHGGMARVFLAVASGPSGFSKLVVLKMIRVHLAEDPDTLQMFLDEARLAGRLNHPNVVHTLEVVEEDGRYLMVMEYLEGQAFASVLRRARRENMPMPLPLYLRGLCDALQGLHYAHELKDFDGTPLNLVHRDVSPQNIFITYDGQVKMLDFGIAKAITSSSETKAGVIKGKIAYMAPEQFLGEKLDRRVDIYAMGAVLWQAATGQRLWKGVPDGQVIHRVIRGEVPEPMSVNPGVHPELARIVMKALARDRADRYATCLELQSDLDALIDSLGEKVSGRDVGNFVGDMFVDVRKEIAATIEAQLSKAQNYDTQAFDRTVIPAIQSMTNPGSLLSMDSSGQHLRSLSGMKMLSPGHTDSEIISASVRSNAILSNSVSGAHPVGGRKSGLLIAVVAALFVGIAGTVWLVPSVRSAISGEQTPATPSDAPATAVAQPSTPQPAQSTESTAKEPAATQAEIEIRAEPANARIFFEGAELATNPATRRVPKDGKVYKIRVEAKGFESREVEVTGEKDVVVTVALDKSRAIGGPAVAPPRVTKEDPKGHKPPETAPPPTSSPPPPKSTKT
ncbi:MAG TPA: serine/threonine-protein kinase, partial [Polyangiaceae bacterium]|nr:serine/threonine-protein kinase [Polyangiaceae bacterium]